MNVYTFSGDFYVNVYTFSGDFYANVYTFLGDFLFGISWGKKCFVFVGRFLGDFITLWVVFFCVI